LLNFGEVNRSRVDGVNGWFTFNSPMVRFIRSSIFIFSLSPFLFFSSFLDGLVLNHLHLLLLISSPHFLSPSTWQVLDWKQHTLACQLAHQHYNTLLSQKLSHEVSLHPNLLSKRAVSNSLVLQRLLQPYHF